MVVGLIATAHTPAVAPLACGVTWTMVGGTIIFLPDCKDQSPQPPPPSPQPDPATPPGPPSTP
ncbi:hypothetical protein [Mycobacterium rhizamassiliense]|uniref:hypothetical protein n=1 Tax=Mycobacterium rhizamassiliense TaxID=1841860 RepID=UPI00097D9FF2|nr:hypothetical protein [Mycobacterium rhizamassiliense]